MDASIWGRERRVWCPSSFLGSTPSIQPLVYPRWRTGGTNARITARQGARDHTREAIEPLSHGAPTRHLYAHTGFRQLPGGKRVYLHAGGAIGTNGAEVELEPGLERYALPPASSNPEELADAVRLSFALSKVVPWRITGPLLGALYLAPLSEIVVPDFVLWLWGATGSFKSTLAALILSHFGNFSETTLPLSFESTANALERSLFLLKDVVAVVDDWRPAVSRSDASEMDRKAQRLLRAVGNRQGRGRMTSDTTLRCSYSPRGLVIATAEALPEGPAFESAAARSLSMNLLREDVNLRGLSELQRHKQSFRGRWPATSIGSSPDTTNSPAGCLRVGARCGRKLATISRARTLARQIPLPSSTWDWRCCGITRWR